MRRPLTALFAALEALLVVGIGIGIPLLPLTLMWAIQYGLQVDWVIFWRAAVDVWLLGHGADITFALEPSVAAGTGIAGATTPFAVTIAPLAFALITGLLGSRAGRRIGETSHQSLGLLVAVGVFAVLSLGATLSAITPLAQPSVWQGAVLPTLVFALGVAVGSGVSARGLLRPEVRQSGAIRLIRSSSDRVLSAIDERMPDARAAAAIALRGGAIVVGLVLACASIAAAVLLAINYGKVIALYEGVHAGALGGAALTIAQLAIIPNVVVWTASWFAGPGFAVGTGSLVSPLGTGLGPIPALPVFGALPTADLAWGFLGLLIPVVAGFLVSAVLRRRIIAAGITTRGSLIATGMLIGVAGGAILGALCWISAGAAGPGRLVDVGPSWLAVALVSVLEIGVPATLALLVGGRDDRSASPRAGSADRRADDAATRTAPDNTATDRPDAGRPDAGRPNVDRPDADRPDAGRPNVDRGAEKDRGDGADSGAGANASADTDDSASAARSDSDATGPLPVVAGAAAWARWSAKGDLGKR